MAVFVPVYAMIASMKMAAIAGPPPPPLQHARAMMSLMNFLIVKTLLIATVHLWLMEMSQVGEM
jgi:hypothetical protein